MTDDAVATPATQPRAGAYVVGFLVFRIFNAVYWALVGGFGWGFGAALGALLPWPDAGLVGGVIGLAVVLLAVLTIDPGSKRTEQTPIQLAGFGGAAVGSASLLILAPFSRELSMALGAVAGLRVGGPRSGLEREFCARTRGAAAGTRARAGAC